MESLGTYIRVRREKLGMSQMELAKKVGTYQPEISDYESDVKVPQLPTLGLLAQALNVTRATILKRVP